MNINSLLDKPRIIGVIGDINQAKSMLLYHMLTEWAAEGSYNLYTFGLRVQLEGAIEIHSVAELEGVRDSVILVDEISSLFDLENRKTRVHIENTLRLINHNNNVLVLAGPPENFKKFLAAKLDVIIYKQCTVADFINGSRAKLILTSYRGPERGSELLNLSKDRAIMWDGKHYAVMRVPYYANFDTKANNAQILKSRTGKSAENVDRV